MSCLSFGNFLVESSSSGNNDVMLILQVTTQQTGTHRIKHQLYNTSQTGGKKENKKVLKPFS